VQGVLIAPQPLEAAGMLPEGYPAASLNRDEAPAPASAPGVDRDFAVVGATAVERLVSLVQHNQRGVPAHPQTILLEGRSDGGGRVGAGE